MEQHLHVFMASCSQDKASSFCHFCCSNVLLDVSGARLANRLFSNDKLCFPIMCPARCCTTLLRVLQIWLLIRLMWLGDGHGTITFFSKFFLKNQDYFNESNETFRTFWVSVSSIFCIFAITTTKWWCFSHDVIMRNQAVALPKRTAASFFCSVEQHFWNSTKWSLAADVPIKQLN